MLLQDANTCEWTMLQEPGLVTALELHSSPSANAPLVLKFLPLELARTVTVMPRARLRNTCMVFNSSTTTLKPPGCALQTSPKACKPDAARTEFNDAGTEH